MADKDTSTNASDPKYRITIKGDHERADVFKAAASVAAGMFLGPSQFMCSKCGGAVSVSKKKAAKLRKRKRVTILCKKCKKAIKARRRGK